MDWAFFAVNGLHFCGIFKEKKLSFGFREKRREKISEIRVTFENYAGNCSKSKMRVEQVKSSENKGKKICFANFGILAGKTWKIQNEGGIGEIQ